MVTCTAILALKEGVEEGGVVSNVEPGLGCTAIFGVNGGIGMAALGWDLD